MKIPSPEVLKKILQTNDLRHHYLENFCLANRMINTEYKVANLFEASNKSLSLEDLQKKLPFVPQEKILTALSDRKKYLETTNGNYLAIAKIQFDEDEILKAKKKIFFHINKKGYADPKDYNLTSNFAINSEVNPKDLLNIIHEKFFSDSFIKRGKKFFERKTIQPKSTQKSSEDKLTKILIDRDEIDLATLLSAGDITTVLSRALKIMIRVSEKIFVKSTRIKFDIKEIDEALTPFVQEKITPLQAITSFNGFPPIKGYSWNLFLLESFLRRYSRKYRFMTRCAGNSKSRSNLSASMKFKDYLDVQSAAVVNANIPLEKNTIKKFLIEKGYGATHFENINEQIISRA